MTLNRKLVGLALASLIAIGGVTAVRTIASADEMPEPTQLTNVAGVWNTSWGSESCELTLRQNGNAVSGSYVTTGAPPGTVTGVMNGNVLMGRWSDSSSTGGFRLMFMSPTSFTGTWGSGGSYDDGGNWDGTKR